MRERVGGHDWYWLHTRNPGVYSDESSMRLKERYIRRNDYQIAIASVAKTGDAIQADIIETEPRL